MTKTISKASSDRNQIHVYVCSKRFNTYAVYPKKYAYGFCFDVLCCGYTLTDFPISIRLTSLALWQSNDCPSASKVTLMNMDKYLMWIHYERLHNHNKAKHNKTVCIFLGIYCTVNQAHTKYQFTDSHTNMVLRKFIATLRGTSYCPRYRHWGECCWRWKHWQEKIFFDKACRNGTVARNNVSKVHSDCYKISLCDICMWKLLLIRSISYTNFKSLIPCFKRKYRSRNLLVYISAQYKSVPSKG